MTECKNCVIVYFFLLFEIRSDFSSAVIIPSFSISDFKAINCEFAEEVEDPISKCDDCNNQLQLKKTFQRNAFNWILLSFIICA